MRMRTGSRNPASPRAVGDTSSCPRRRRLVAFATCVRAPCARGVPSRCRPRRGSARNAGDRSRTVHRQRRRRGMGQEVAASSRVSANRLRSCSPTSSARPPWRSSWARSASTASSIASSPSPSRRCIVSRERSTSSSGTASWRCSARRSRTRITPGAHSSPRSASGLGGRRAANRRQQRARGHG